MGTLEPASCVLVASALVAALAAAPDRLRLVVAVAALVVAGGLWAAQPVRWQLAPLVLGALILAGLVLARVAPGWLRGVGLGLAAPLVVLGSALLVLMPLRFLPEPTGAHRVGTTVFSVTDMARPEIFLPGSGRARTLTVQAWYPTDDTAGPVEPYLRDPAALTGLTDYVGVPSFVMGYLHAAPTHALADAPTAPGRWPVVFALTGNMGYRQSQTVQVEELASRGYVVIGIDQPGTASSALLLDGTRIPYAGSKVLKPVIDQSIETASVASTLHGTPYPRGLAPYLAADLRFVLDRLTALDAAADGPLAGHLDLARVGAFGVSLGGYELSQWCATDVRVRACLFVDAPMTLDAVATGLDVPALWLTRPAADMIAEGWSPGEVRHFDGTQRALFAATRASAWYVTVAGVLHADLTDAPFGSPLFRFSGLTSGDGVRVHQVLRTVSADFFDRALRGADGGVLDRESPWPGVSVGSRP